MLPSYASPYAIGHRAIADLFTGPVVIQEKLDGSQFSFGVDEAGQLFCRSKGCGLHIEAPDKMFAKGIESVKTLTDRLTPGFVYRGEYLQRPKHNALAYDRVPNQHVILFDVERTAGSQDYLSSSELAAEATRLGLEATPVLFEGVVDDVKLLRELLDKVSVLGGQKIEGVVVKNYALCTTDHKVMMGKFVSESFKEVHRSSWKEANPAQGDVLASLIRGLKTPARWAKAVQHLREAGTLTETPTDIGSLIKEVRADIKKECSEEIKDVLFQHFIGDILRGVTGGLPEWYKEQIGILSLSMAEVSP